MCTWEYVGSLNLGVQNTKSTSPSNEARYTLHCSLLDPLGFAAPVALTTLCVVQDLWKANVGWDEPLSNEFLSGEYGTLSYTRCISFGPTSCLTVTCVNASYSLMCFQMRQRLLMERHHICEASTTMDEVIAPSSLAKLGTPL